MFLFNQGLWDKSRSKRSTQLQPKGQKGVIMRKFGYSSAASGFTLLELIVAIAIASVVMGIAIPSFLSWMPTLRLSSGARQVAMDLQVARMKAISQNVKYRLNFVTATSYTFEKDADNNGVFDSPAESGPFSLPDGITVTATGALASEFQPRGTVNVASEITLQNGNSETKKVQVAVVGRVKLL